MALGSHVWRRRFAQIRRGTRKFTGRNPDVQMVDERGVPYREPGGRTRRLCTRTKKSALALVNKNDWKGTDKVRRKKNQQGKIVYCLYTR